MRVILSSVFTILLLVSGCGGGGGGGGGVPPPNPVPPPVPPPNSSAPLELTTGNAQDVVSIVLSAANDKIQLAHAAGHLAAEIIEQGAPFGFEICSDTGEYSGLILDDGDGLYSIGDSLSINFGSCTSGNVVSNVVSSGEVTITAIAATPTGEFQVSGDYQTPGDANSAMEIAYAVTVRGESVVVRSNDAGARLVIGDNAFTDFMFRFDTKGLTVNGRYSIQFEASVESDELGGAFSCTTEELYHSIRTRQPVRGRLSCSGAGAAIARQSTFAQNTDVVEFSPDGTDPFQVVGALGLGNVVDDFLFGIFAGQPLEFPGELPLLPTQQVAIASRALAGNPSDGIVYAITTSDDAQWPDSLVAINSSTGAIVDTLQFAAEPVALGLAADSTVAYVGFKADRMIRKVDLNTFGEIEAIDLGVSADGPLYAGDIAVSPESADDFAVAIRIDTTSSGTFAETALYRGGVKQPRTLASVVTVNIVEFSSRGDTLFGGNSFSTGYQLYVIDVVADGLQVRQALDDFVGIEFPFAVENDTIYTVDGNAVDAETETILGEFLDRFELHRFRRVVRPDADNNRVYFYNSVFEAYEQDTFVPVSAYRIDDAAPAHSLVHTSGSRLVLATDTTVHLIDKNSIVDFEPFPCEAEVLDDVINDASYPMLACFFHDALYSSVRNKIYAALQSLNGQTGNSIAEIDPDTLSIERLLFIGSEPNYLAISDDGDFIFVGAEGSAEIVRVDVENFEVVSRTKMTVDPLDGPVRPGDMEVLPGSNEDIVVSLRNRQFTVEYRGIALYRNGIEAPLVTGGAAQPYAREIEIAPTGNRVYGLNTETTAFDFTTSDLDSSGVFNMTPQFEAGAFFSQFELADGGLYLSTGEVIDTATLSFDAAFPIDLFEERNRLVEPLPVSDRTYFYYRNHVFDREMTVEQFSNGSRALVGTLDLPRFNFGLGSELQLEAVGSDRVILVTEDRMLVLADDQFASQ